VRGYVRANIIGLSNTSKKVKLGKGMNVQFDRNGNFAALIERTNSKVRQKKIVPLAKIPGSYRRNEFVDMYSQVQSSPPQQIIINQATPQPAQPVIEGPKCRYCGATMDIKATFCQTCGAPKN
jgi:hypothetical protein